MLVLIFLYASMMLSGLRTSSIRPLNTSPAFTVRQMSAAYRNTRRAAGRPYTGLFFLSFGIRHHLPFEKSDPFGLTRILMIGLNNACFHNSTCDHSSIPITGTSSVRSLLFSSGSPAYCSSSGSSLRKPLPFLVPVILSVHLYL